MENLDLTTDGHIHTRFCHHARGEMEDYVVAAIDKGLQRMVFLEHLEIGINYFESTWLNDDDFDQYFATGFGLRKKYGDEIEIGLGVEVGYNPERITELKSFLGKYQWDRVGLSYHFLASSDGRHLNMLSRKQANMVEFSQLGVAEVVTMYFDGLLDAVRRLDGDVLCHLDAVLRHHPEISFSPQHDQQINKILREMAARKMALEVNTSGFVHRKEPYPKPWIIMKAMMLGLPLALGSDAHTPQDVGRYFEHVPGFLRLSKGDGKRDNI